MPGCWKLRGVCKVQATTSKFNLWNHVLQFTYSCISSSYINRIIKVVHINGAQYTLYCTNHFIKFSSSIVAHQFVQYLIQLIKPYTQHLESGVGPLTLAGDRCRSRPWPSGHTGGRQGRPRCRQVAPDGSPGPSKCELQLLHIDLGTLVPILSRAALRMTADATHAGAGAPVCHAFGHFRTHQRIT